MKTRLVFFACLAALLLQACQEDPYLTVSPDSLTFSQDGGSQTVRISANYPWTASVSGTGFSVSPASGEGTGSVTVTAAATSSTDPVTGSLTVRSEGLSASVSLTQDAKFAILVGSGATIPAEGGSYSVDIQYNTDFTVEVEASAKSWITFNGTKAMQSGKLEFLFAANETTDPRTGTVTVKDKTGKVSPVTITFTQEEKKVIKVGDTAIIPAEGGTFEVDVQYNTDFTVEVEEAAQDWITFVKTKALQNGKLEFFFAANETTDPRTGTVTVKDKTGKVSPITITFIQEEKKVISVGETTTIPAEGGSFEVDVQYNTDFTVEVEEAAQDWITFVKTKALQNGKLEFFFAANETTDPRTGIVTVKDTKGKVAPITITFIQEEKKVINVGETTTIPAEGGTFEVDVQYNTDFTVEVEEAAQDWITFVKTKALQNGKLEFFFAANETTEPRTGTVTVKDTKGKVAPITITFIQEEKKVINVGETTTIPAEGGTFEVDVQYNTDFTVEIEETAQDWITFVKTKALQNGKLEFLFAANETTEPRTGTVTVKDTKGKVSPITITFIQEEKKVINVGETTTIPAEGGTFEVDVQYNTDFTVEIEETAQDWITFVKTKALQNGKLEFFFAANETTEPRTGTVTVKDTKGKVAPITITFIQEEKKVINVGDVATIPEEGGLIDVDIQYNTDFSVSVEDAAQSWITFVQTKALQNGKLEFEIAANEFDDIREGQVFIQSKDGTQILQTITFKQESKMRRLLMAFYQAMDGPNWTWTIQDNWGTDMPFWSWRGVEGSKDKGVTVLNLQRVGLKGSIPDIIGEFTNLNSFHVDAPGITGTLPETFRQLINLTNLYIVNTSMTSLPDVFSDMKKLEFAQIIQNEQMTGPLPESIGLSPVLERLNISNNAFTGGLPESWAHLGEKLYLGNNCLSGTIPQAYLDSEYLEYYMSEFLWQKTGYGFDISGIEIPRSKCLGTAEDLDGNTLSFNEIIGKNRYTVYLVWTPWDPYSRTLLLQMKDYYEEFHEAGLEVIATGMTDRSGNIWTDKNEQKQYILDNGLDSWCNIYYPSTSDYPAIPMSLPNAEVYDSNGNIVFSGFYDYPDPVRDRFGKIASTDLLPFLETLFGPLSYTSTDYSHDGEVVTMQTATVGNGINIVFMGDAYTDKDIESGVYENVMRRSMEEFFAIEPYKTFRNRFNVYMVKVVSPNGKVGEGYTTALGTKLLGGTTIVGNADKSETYSLLVPSITSTENLLTCVMVNEYKYAGTALMSRTAQSGVAFTATESKDPVIYGSTLRHEAGGHGFAFLADEYPSFEQTIPDYKVEEYKDLYNQFGWYQNVDFTNDPSKVHWSVFLADDRYKSEVGIYEGAFYYLYGVWRPSENSKMKDNLEYFNAPSRWAIYKRIMELSGEEYSFEKFLEYDAVNRGAAAAAAAAVRPPMNAAAKRHTGPTAPPIIRP